MVVADEEARMRADEMDERVTEFMHALLDSEKAEYYGIEEDGEFVYSVSDAEIEHYCCRPWYQRTWPIATASAIASLLGVLVGHLTN